MSENKEQSLKYVLDENNEKAYQEMLRVCKLPLFVQKYLYFNSKVVKHYYARMVVKKEDRISVIDAVYQLRIGTNGLFIRRKSDDSVGVTYMKKGRSSSRLSEWGNIKSSYDKSKHKDLTKELAKIVNPEAIELLEDPVIRSISTKGMRGAILAGKITSEAEAMQYFIRYSLRGVGVKQEYDLAIYKFYKDMYGSYEGTLVLRTAKDPNLLLEQFQEPGVNTIKLTRNIVRHGSQLCHKALSSGETIDWVDKNFNAKDTAERLSMKERRIEDFLNLWDGGPVLNADTQSQFNNASVPF